MGVLYFEMSTYSELEGEFLSGTLTCSVGMEREFPSASEFLLILCPSNSQSWWKTEGNKDSDILEVASSFIYFLI